MRRRRAIGVALAVVGLLVWGGLVTKIDIERGGGRHGLKWPPFYQNKQQSNGGRRRREGVRLRGDSAGEERVGMMVAHRLGGGKWRDKKREMGGPLALDGRLLIG